MELPDFKIPLSEKIDWMIETKGWAIEPVLADIESAPPRPPYAYTIGLPALVKFPEVVVFGLTPVAASGLLELVVDALQGGTDIPIGVEVVGLLDNELRCCFAPVDVAAHRSMFSTADAWYSGGDYEAVQLIYPDRDGWMPYESGFDARMRFAQPVVGDVA